MPILQCDLLHISFAVAVCTGANGPYWGPMIPAPERLVLIVFVLVHQTSGKRRCCRGTRDTVSNLHCNRSLGQSV
jgi:hypothetical protein